MPRPAKTRNPFSRRLVRIRKSKGITQIELAKMTRLSQRAIAHYETVGRNPSPDIAVRLSKALKITVDELMGYKSVHIKEDVSPKVVKRAKLIDRLSGNQKKIVLDLIDSYSNKRSGRL